jgi:hypothetical protein
VEADQTGNIDGRRFYSLIAGLSRVYWESIARFFLSIKLGIRLDYGMDTPRQKR